MMKDRELTKKRLLSVVGEIIRSQGFHALTISKVAKLAELDRKLIYRYFGGFNGLIEAYVVQNDYWMIWSSRITEAQGEMDFEGDAQAVIKLLQQQFNYFLKESDMQNLILLELSENVSILKSIHQVRELIGQKLFEKSEPFFENRPVNIRAITALLVGGIYYVILHTRHNGTQFADLDVSSEEGQKALLKAIGQVVSWAFDAKND